MVNKKIRFKIKIKQKTENEGKTFKSDTLLNDNMSEVLNNNYCIDNSYMTKEACKYYTEEFTPSNEYDDNVGLIDGEHKSNISSSFEGTPILDKDNTTQYPPNENVNFGRTQVKGINTITGKPITEYSQKYNSNSTYYDHLEDKAIETR